MKNCFILSWSRNELLPRGCYFFFFAFVLLGKILHGDRRRNMVLRGVGGTPKVNLKETDTRGTCGSLKVLGDSSNSDIAQL